MVLDRSIIKFGLCVFILLSFMVGCWIIIAYDIEHSKSQFEIHATIISDDIWAIDASGAASYLHLAIQANHYKSITVIQNDGELLLHEENLSPVGFDRYFQKIGLLPLRRLQTPISYGDRVIATLAGEQYIRLVYPIIEVFFLLMSIGITIFFFLHLMWNRRLLEQQVNIRTRSLKASEKRFHDLVNLLPEMVWEVDRHGVILYANQVAIARFNLFLSHEKKVSWFDFIVSSQRVEAGQSFELTMQGHDVGLLEFRALDKNNVSFPVLIRTAPMVQDGLVVGARCVAIDISERQHLEEELHQAQKMKAIGIMAGGVAHDLNNILSGLVSYPEIILMDLPEGSELKKPVEAIRKSGIQAAEVVSDLLTVARGIAASRKVCKPRELIEEYFDSPDYKKLTSLYPDIEFKSYIKRPTANISCSPIHVRKCLMNLFTNAAEAVEGEGEVIIETSEQIVATDGTEANTLPEGEYVVISVRDTGAGVSENDVIHIFEPFYSKKIMGRSGTGLGLSVVWNTLQDHGGTVFVKSVSGDTVFSMFFPVTREIIAQQVNTIDWTTLKGNRERILVIDDEKQQREISTKLLTLLNYQVVSVASGEKGLDYLQKNKVDLLFLDMLMEPGMSGYETYKKAILNQPGIKAVIASGYAESEDVRKTLELGAGLYITKPYTMEVLGSGVRDVLSS